MADIELVIKIPEYMLKDIQDRYKHPNKGNGINLLEYAVANGIPLPKGHGDLKDATDLLKITSSYKSELGRLKVDPVVECGVERVESFIRDALTVIEADKAESKGGRNENQRS